MKLLINRITCCMVMVHLGFVSLFSQAISSFFPSCGFDHHIHHLCEEDPDLRKEIDQFLNDVVPTLASTTKNAAEELLTISVVVHVIHAGEPIGQGPNISDQQVIDQIGVLNEDFCSINRKFWDTPTQWMGLAGTPNIQFLLATVDPDGNPTNGITRHNIPITGSSWNSNNINSEIKPSVNWDPDRYMNIYVVSIPGTTSAGGVVGYSNYPTASLIGADRDGPVIDYNWFGGPGHAVSGWRAISHETGHYLGLPHPFNGTSCNADDGIDDTPNIDDATLSYVTLDCDSGFPTGPVSCTEEHMYVNFMDYVDEGCYTSFTQGQVNVMRSVLDGTSAGFGYGSREELLLNAPQQTFIPANDAGITRVVSPESVTCTSDDLIPTVTLRNFGSDALTQATINYFIDNGPLISFNWQGSLFPGESTNVDLPAYTPPDGAYTISIFSDEPNAGGDDRIFNDTFSTSLFTYFAFDPPMIELVDGSNNFPTELGTYEFNFGDDDFAWDISYDAAAYGYGLQSFVFNNRAGNLNNNPSDTYDLLITRHFDFSDVNSAALYFDVAYAPFSPLQTDTLYILVATECSQNFNLFVYKKWGTELATAPATDDLFIPTPSQWRTEAVDLSFFDGQEDVTIGFLNVSNWGNQLFIDNIRVGVDCGLMTAEWEITPDGCDNPPGTCTGEAEINVPISNGDVAFAWENIPTNPSQSSVSDLCPGNIAVTIVDEFGCQIEVSNEIPAGESLELTSSTTNETNCQENGIATVFVANGSAPFTYQMDGGQSFVSNENFYEVNNLAAGEYTFTVTDAANCSNTQVILVESTGSDLNASASLTQSISCFGANDGVVQAIPENGQSPFSFSWSNGMSTAIIADASPGTYTVTITDFNGCQAIASVEVPEPIALTATVTSTPVTAANSNDGTATVVPTGGTQDYSFLWNTGATTALITGLAPGQYSVTVTDANNCSTTESVIIQSIDCSDFQTTISWENLTCFSANDGTATVTVSGETPPVTYNWNNGETGPMIENLTAGTYSVTVMDGDGCSAELSALVQAPTELTVSLTSMNESAPGASDGSATASPAGGTPFGGGDYQYSWSNGGTTASISGLSPGTYTVTITDANGCTVSGSVTVASTNCQLSILMESSNASCPNGADGTASVTEVSTGTAPFSFMWSNGETGQMIENLLPGDYYVTVTDMVGCSAQGWVPIIGMDTEVPTLVFFDEITLQIEDETVTFDPSSADNGSADNCSMLNFETAQTEFDCSNVGSQTVTITVSDESGNSANGFVTLIIEDAVAPEINCPDDITVIDCGEVDYILPTAVDNCDMPSLSLVSGFESGSIFPNGTTTVEWEAVDLSNNSSTCSFEVFVDYNFQLTDAILTNPTCADAMDGSIDLFLEGGLEPYQSMWSHGGGPTNLSAGVYSVTITDSNGCTLHETYELQEPPGLEIELIEIVPAMGGVSTGSIQITINGGDPPITVDWYENGILLPDFDPFLAPPGTYTVSVSDYNGCEMQGGPYLVDNLNSTISTEFESSIAVFPNPSNGEVSIEFSAPLTTLAQVSVFDITGKACSDKIELSTNSANKLNLTSLVQGVYWIKIISANKMAWKKLVIL
ncbi:MAG: M43 family zinc metalloprotease [Bacteroidota bacterium]